MFDNTQNADSYAQEFKELDRLLRKSGKNDQRVGKLVASMVEDMRKLEQLLSKPLVRAVLEHVQEAEAARDRLYDLEIRVNGV